MPNRLYVEHEELRRRMRDFASLMMRDAVQAGPDLLPARVAFSALYHRHRAAEAAFANAAAAANPALAPLAARLAGGDPELDAAYSAHVRRWTPRRIIAEWQTYRNEVLSLQRRHLDRMAWEEREAIPVLAIARGGEPAGRRPVAIPPPPIASGA